MVSLVSFYALRITVCNQVRPCLLPFECAMVSSEFSGRIPEDRIGHHREAGVFEKALGRILSSVSCFHHSYFRGGAMSTITQIGITRDDAMALLKTHLRNDKLVSHCVAAEAIMRALAEKFGEDPDIWGLAGLLHDLDYEITGEDSATHGLETEKLLQARNVSPVLSNVIKKHNAEGLGLERSTRLEYALTCAETITGLIVATALVYPDKKIASVKPKSVTKRMKTKHFARAVSRERIMECEKMGMSLNEFVALSLEAMAGIADKIGL